MTQQQFPSEQFITLTLTPSQAEIIQESLGLYLEKEEKQQLAANHINQFITFLLTQQLRNQQNNS